MIKLSVLLRKLIENKSLQKSCEIDDDTEKPEAQFNGGCQTLLKSSTAPPRSHFPPLLFN